MSNTDAKAILGKGWHFPIVINSEEKIQQSEYERDIEQAIRIILGTAQGERVMRPDFGAGLKRLVFQPINTTTLAQIKHLVQDALVQWEPRINQVEISVNAKPRASKVDIHIGYSIRRTNTFYNLVYPFYFAEGEPQ